MAVKTKKFASLRKQVTTLCLAGAVGGALLFSSGCGDAPAKIVRNQGYTQISDSSAVESAVNEVIDSNPKALADYMEGKENAAKFLVGQVMKATRGQAKPELVNTLVNQELEARKNNTPSGQPQ